MRIDAENGSVKYPWRDSTEREGHAYEKMYFDCSCHNSDGYIYGFNSLCGVVAARHHGVGVAE